MDLRRELFKNKFKLPQEFKSPALLDLTEVADCPGKRTSDRIKTSDDPRAS